MCTISSSSLGLTQVFIALPWPLRITYYSRNNFTSYIRDENCKDKGPANDFSEAKMSHCVLFDVRAELCSLRHCLAGVNCVPSCLDKIALHVEIRLNVGRNAVSRQIAFRIPHPSLNLCGEAKSKVQVSLPGFKVFCSTPDRPVPISPQAWAAPLCAMTGSPTKKKKSASVTTTGTVQ